MAAPLRHALALLLTAALGAPVAASPLQVEQVAPGVYVHVGAHKDFDDGYDGDIANIGFIVGSKAVAIVDSGGAYAVGMALKEAVRAVTPLPIRYLINTHGHPDHVFGNAAFTSGEAAPSAARVIGHAHLPAALAARRDAYVRTLKTQLGAAEPALLVGADQLVTERIELDLGGRSLVLTAWPAAHSSADLTVFDSASGALWTGDLLFAERTPALDGDITGWLGAIVTLKALAAAVTVPGHGPVLRSNGAKNQALDRQGAYLTALLRDVRSDIRAGTSMTAAMHTAAAAERGHWRLFDVVNRRNVNYLFPLLEWE